MRGRVRSVNILFYLVVTERGEDISRVHMEIYTAAFAHVQKFGSKSIRR